MSSLNGQAEDTTQESHTSLYVIYNTLYNNCPWLQDLTPHLFLCVFFFIVSSFLCYYEKELIKSVLFHDLFHDSSGMPHAK